LDKRKDSNGEYQTPEAAQQDTTSFSSDMNYDAGSIGGDTKDNLPF